MVEPDLLDLSKDLICKLFELQQQIVEAGMDKQKVFQIIVDSARSLTGAEGSAVEMIDGDELIYVAVSGRPVRDALGLRLKIQGSLSGVCMRERELVYSRETETDERVDRAACRKIGCRSMALVPLLSPKGIVGVLKIFATQPDAFTEDQMKALPHLSKLLGSSLRNALALASEAEKLEAIFARIDTPMVLFRGPQLVIEMANKKYRDTISDRPIVGLSFAEAFPELVGTQLPALMREVYDSGETRRISEDVVVPLDSRAGHRANRFFDSSFTRIEGLHEHYIIGFALDVTSRVLDRQRLLLSKKEAENAAELKTSFLANMSHEIRTPLGVILGFTEMMREGDVGLVERKQYLNTISRNGKALARIIDDILDLAKVESGKLEIEKVEFSLSELIEDVLDVFQEQAHTKNIYLDSDLSLMRDDVFVGDPTRLRQIFLNVVGNAIKFTEKGGVRISASQKNYEGISKIRFVINDSGIGLTSEQKSRLFTPFTQADNSTTRKFGGTGLGLALSRRLARALGGDVRVLDDEQEVGSTFEISFAAKRIEAASLQSVTRLAPVAETVKHQPLRRLSILLVDDSADNRALVQLMLSKAGAQVSTANDGAEAVAKGMSDPYDLILMDIQMPGVDGLEATRRLRSSGLRVPIIALTAHAMIEEREKSLAAGCNYHLTKPINKPELIRTILEATGLGEPIYVI
jgi:signal transduction histidine kinase/ActR/RegA family two-component response regulator